MNTIPLVLKSNFNSLPGVPALMANQKPSPKQSEALGMLMQARSEISPPKFSLARILSQRQQCQRLKWIWPGFVAQNGALLDLSCLLNYGIPSTSSYIVTIVCICEIMHTGEDSIYRGLSLFAPLTLIVILSVMASS